MKPNPDRTESTSGEKGQGNDAPRSGLPARVRWFISKTVREAAAMRKHVGNILNAQRDLLSPKAVGAVTASLDEMQTALHTGASKEGLREEMKKLEACANEWLKPHPHAGIRENVEVLLVALAVAMGIRTFFLQPFKIPTGSMQPTLFGVMSTPNLNPRALTSQAELEEQIRAQKALQAPTGLTRLREWFEGISYIDIKAKVDGTLNKVDEPFGIRIIDFWQTLEIAGVKHTIYLPPDYGSERLADRAGLIVNQSSFHKGDTVVKMKMQAGDHLFVDRITYNFRKPHRGEIVVFQTAGMDPDRRARYNISGDQFYIKRLVALGGEKVQIGSDNHLIIDGKRLDTSARGFENVYGWAKPDPSQPYIGHLPLNYFENGGEYQVHPGRFMVMGDNTRNSLDSRYFGDVDENSIIGKSFFVYWPITSRFGLGYR